MNDSIQVLPLTREQVERLIALCEANHLEKYFVAKDQGAYVGASAGPAPEQKVIYYFEGCDPEKDENWYENAREDFGGDDFGVHLPVSGLIAMLARKGTKGINIVVTPEYVRLERIT
jgi:hypothetical protein